jgi:lipoprotein-releasing system permease protein
MSRLPFEAFLALRYLRPRRTFVSVITVISIVGVLLGVAVLIIVIAVMSGFDQQWRDTIMGFNAHLKVYPAERNQSLTNYQSVLRIVAANPAVTGVSPFIRTRVLLKTEPDNGEPSMDAPELVGVDPDSVGKVTVLPRSIVAGSFDLADNGLLVGRDFASRMGLDIGNRVAIYSTSSVQKMQAGIGKTNAEVVLPEDFTVRGIFDVGSPDFNSLVIVTSLEDARNLLKMPDSSAQALQVKLRDPFLADKVKGELEKVLPDDLAVYTWFEERAGGGKEHNVLCAFFHHDCGGVRHRQLPDYLCRPEDARDRHPQGARRQRPANSVGVSESESGGGGAGGWFGLRRRDAGPGLPQPVSHLHAQRHACGPVAGFDLSCL